MLKTSHFFFKYKVKVILILHSEESHVQKNISAILYRKLDTYHREEYKFRGDYSLKQITP